MKKKIGGVVVACLVLFGCHGYRAATGSVSPSGTNYTAEYDRDFQVDAGYPVLFITYMCHGDTTWRNGPNVNAVGYPSGDIVLSVYCASGFAQAFPNDAHS